MPTQESIIKTQNISKVYKSGEIFVNALNGVSIDIKKGEFTAIVGPSGSGKSTLLNIISGLDIPTKGSVYLNKKNISKLTGGNLSDFRRDHIGFIFQAYNLIPVLSVKENIEYIMLLQGVQAKERAHRVSEILNAVELSGMEDRKPTQLSGGQQQRVAIARAMVSRPSIILADEPTANLDSETSYKLLDIMHNLNKTQGMTFLFSTHDTKIMEKAERLIVLKDGCVEQDKIKN